MIKINTRSMFILFFLFGFQLILFDSVITLHKPRKVTPL